MPHGSAAHASTQAPLIQRSRSSHSLSDLQPCNTQTSPRGVYPRSVSQTQRPRLSTMRPSTSEHGIHSPFPSTPWSGIHLAIGAITKKQKQYISFDKYCIDKQSDVLLTYGCSGDIR